MIENIDPGILDSHGGTAGKLRPVREILDASTVARDAAFVALRAMLAGVTLAVKSDGKDRVYGQAGQ